MKKIKYVLAAFVVLLIGAFTATGCNEKEIRLNFFDNVTEITYSVYPSDEIRTHVTDEEYITLLSSFFSDSEYKKITDEDANEDISKSLIMEVVSEEAFSNISVYPDGRVTVSICGIGYISVSSAADYEGLLAKMQELRIEYEQYKNTCFLREFEELMFLMNRYESSYTHVTDKEDQDKIISVLSSASYRDRRYDDEDGDFVNSKPIIICGEDWEASISVYPEDFVDVTVRREDGSLEYYISDNNVDYEELVEVFKNIREKNSQAKGSYFLGDPDEMMFLIYPHDSNTTFVTDKEDRDNIRSFLTASTYRPRSDYDEVGDLSKELIIDMKKDDCYTSVYVYPEGFARVTVQNPEDGSYKYYISEYGIDYDGVLELLKELREEWRESIKS